MTKEKISVGVKHCARCQQDHRIDFLKLVSPSSGITHWGTCPETQEPILLTIVDKDAIQPEPTEPFIGLHRNNPLTPEGKFPIVLRRDGTAVEERFFVVFLQDPCAEACIKAYANDAVNHNFADKFIEDVYDLAEEAGGISSENSDPDAALHRVDDPRILAWARSIGCPGS